MRDPDKMPPREIVRNGYRYVMEASSQYNAILERERRKADLLAWPPPEKVGLPMSPTQEETLHRIAASPSPVTWSGMLFMHSAFYHGSNAIPLAPKLGGRTIANLWHRGLLRRVKSEELTGDVIVLSSPRGEREIKGGLLAFERRRWFALQQLGRELAAEWREYRELYHAGALADPLKRPSPQVTQAKLVERMASIEWDGHGAWPEEDPADGQ